MKFKKFISGLLTAALLVGLLPAALAAGTPTVSISSGTVKAGETVTLTVSIKDNPGLATYMLFFYYDTSAFEMDIERDMASAGGFRNGMLLGNTIALAKENNSYRGLPGKDGTVAGWFALSDVAADGDVMTVTLRAKKEIPNGEYTIGLGYSKEDTSNVDGKTIELKTNSAVVTVTGGTGTKPPETQQPETTVPVFPDAMGHWAQEYIEKAAAYGLIMGNDYGMYMPDKTMTRAECVTILWRACGSPKATKAAPFTDLDPDQTWYHEAAAWSAENGVIKGTGDGTTFSPYDNVNRDQLATILFRLAGSPAAADANQIMAQSLYKNYPDHDKLADWAKQGVYWAVYRNIYCGENSVEFTQLNSTHAANRAQIAVMVVRYLEKY